MFTTKDLYLAAALQEAGSPLRDLWKEGSRATFAFDDTEEVTSNVAAYYSGELQLPAHRLGERIRSAKSAAMNAPERGVIA